MLCVLQQQGRSWFAYDDVTGLEMDAEKEVTTGTGAGKMIYFCFVLRWLRVKREVRLPGRGKSRRRMVTVIRADGGDLGFWGALKFDGF